MKADSEIRLLHDRVLADRASRGDAGAFDELYRRYAHICWRLAVAIGFHSEPAAEAVTRAFAVTLAGGGATPAAGRGLRLPLLLATRRASTALAGPATVSSSGVAEGGLAVNRLPAGRALEAFHALPERSRTAVWLVDVEGLSPVDAAYVLEIAPRAGASLAGRARLGLREHVLHAGQPRRARPAQCRLITESLPGYADGSLDEAEELSVRAHLDSCLPCQDRLAELDDLAVRLRRATPALPPTLANHAARRWSGSLVREPGPLHLHLPGGQPLPAWLERTIAGTVAAAIAVGVSVAVLAGGGGRARHDSTVRPAAAGPLPGGYGESALGIGDGLPELVLDGDGFVPPVSVAGGPPAPVPIRPPGSAPDHSGAQSTAGGSATIGAAPRTTPGVGASPSTENSSGAAPTPTPSPTPTPNGTVTVIPLPPPPSPVETAPATQVTVGLGDTLAVTVGDACAGVTVLGTVIGCEPATGDEPVTLATGGTLLSPLGLGL